jgi:hypothetical protein
MELPAPPEPARRLRCDRCGCILELTADEMLRCTSGDWARCCMVAMVLEVDDEAVRPNERTELEQRRPQGRRVVPG